MAKFQKFASSFLKYLSFQGSFRLFPLGTEESVAKAEDMECQWNVIEKFKN